MDVKLQAIIEATCRFTKPRERGHRVFRKGIDVTSARTESSLSITHPGSSDSMLRA